MEVILVILINVKQEKFGLIPLQTRRKRNMYVSFYSVHVHIWFQLYLFYKCKYFNTG